MSTANRTPSGFLDLGQLVTLSGNIGADLTDVIADHLTAVTRYEGRAQRAQGSYTDLRTRAETAQAALVAQLAIDRESIERWLTSTGHPQASTVTHYLNVVLAELGEAA